MSRMAQRTSLALVERQVIQALKKACLSYNNRKPEVICIAHENDPRSAHASAVESPASAAGAGGRPSGQQALRESAARSGKPWERGSEGAAAGGPAERPRARREAPLAYTGPAPRSPDIPSEGELSSEGESSSEEPSGPEEAAAAGVPAAGDRKKAYSEKLLEVRKAAMAKRKTAAKASTPGACVRLLSLSDIGNGPAVLTPGLPNAGVALRS